MPDPLEADPLLSLSSLLMLLDGKYEDCTDSMMLEGGLLFMNEMAAFIAPGNEGIDPCTTTPGAPV